MTFLLTGNEKNGMQLWMGQHSSGTNVRLQEVVNGDQPRSGCRTVIIFIITSNTVQGHRVRRATCYAT